MDESTKDVNVIEGVTESGFAFRISEEALDDYETFEALHKVETGSIGYICDVIDKMFDDDYKAALKAHVKKTRGKCSFSGMTEEVMEIMQASSRGKNS